MRHLPGPGRGSTEPLAAFLTGCLTTAPDIVNTSRNERARFDDGEVTPRGGGRRSSLVDHARPGRRSAVPRVAARGQHPPTGRPRPGVPRAAAAGRDFRTHGRRK